MQEFIRQIYGGRAELFLQILHVARLCLDRSQGDVDAVNLQHTLPIPEVAPGDGQVDGSNAALRDRKWRRGSEVIQHLQRREARVVKEKMVAMSHVSFDLIGLSPFVTRLSTREIHNHGQSPRSESKRATASNNEQNKRDLILSPSVPLLPRPLSTKESERCHFPKFHRHPCTIVIFLAASFVLLLVVRATEMSTAPGCPAWSVAPRIAVLRDPVPSFFLSE